MGNSFICPFCHRETTFTNEGLCKCVEHSLIIDPRSHSAYFDDRADSYLLESQKFLRLFAETDPDMVMSPVELFDKNFKVDACKFINVKHEISDVNCVNVSKLNIDLDIISMKLIAGRGMLADVITDYFKNGLNYSTSNNPIVFEQIPQSERWLWLKVLLESNPYIDNSKIELATNAYFAATLEQKIAWLTKQFDVSLKPLTKEEMLYSYIVTEPWKNIQWGVGVDALTNNIKAFIKACLNDIEKVEVEQKIDAAKVPEFLLNSPKWLQQYSEAYYGGMPSTAVNQFSKDEFITFDILNHDFSYDFFAGHNITKANKDFVAVYNAWLIYKALYDKYCKNEKQLGYNMKLAWLATHEADMSPIYKLSPNMQVVRFWQKMSKELYK